MADPIDFDEANLRLVAPTGEEDEVRSLPVRRADGMIVSCWELTPEERAEVARTGCVWLSVWSPTSSPPVLVAGLKHYVIPPEGAET
ncbi:MAG: hypothetical protein J0H94_03780 [Rhizobiales bacterium]|nr:hypothetical protein [Hyphomicrobiales bacterium]